MSFYTYLHCKPTGEIFYVGKGTGRRAYDVRRNNKHHSDVVKRYGAENIQVFVFPCDSEEQALEDEIQQIRQLRAEGVKLANVTDGGDGISGYHHGDEAKEIIRKTHTGKVVSEETRKRMSEAQKLHSPEFFKKRGEARKGKKHSPETIEKMRAAKLGKKHDPEQGRKISESLRANHPMKGKHHSEEAKSKISASKKGVPKQPFSEEHRNNISLERKAYFERKKTQDVQLQIDLGDSNEQ